jgi:hypothetical protein
MLELRGEQLMHTPPMAPCCPIKFLINSANQLKHPEKRRQKKPIHKLWYHKISRPLKKKRLIRKKMKHLELKERPAALMALQLENSDHPLVYMRYFVTDPRKTVP